MNKKYILLTSFIIVLITANFLNLYLKSEKQLQEEYKRFNEFKKTAYEISALKNRYSTEPVRILKKICTVKNNTVTCKNLSAESLRKVNSFLKSNIPLKKFSITDNNVKFDFYAEIKK